MSAEQSSLADVAAQTATAQAELRELSGLVSELGGTQATHRDELARLDATLRHTASVVDEISEQLEAQSEVDENLTPVAWHTLDRDTAERQWTKLLKWLESVAATYEIRREQVPDCWPRHPAMRNELSWLRTTHYLAYHPTSSAAAAAEWHLRHLPGALDRVRSHTSRGRGDPCADGACRGVRIWDEHPPYEAFSETTRSAVWCRDGISDDLDARNTAPDGGAT